MQGYNEDFAHKLTAAADIWLMPSRFEPCGLNQLYAMRYGSVPVVHATGADGPTEGPRSPAMIMQQHFSSSAVSATHRSGKLTGGHGMAWHPVDVVAA